MIKQRLNANSGLKTLVYIVILSTLLFPSCNVFEDDDDGKIHPKQILLTAVTLNDFPEFKSNPTTPWDESTGPDISLKFNTWGEFTAIFRTDTILNALKDTMYTFEFSQPILLPDMRGTYTLNVYDIDGGIFDFEEMGQFDVDFYGGSAIDPQDSISHKRRTAIGFDVTFDFVFRF